MNKNNGCCIADAMNTYNIALRIIKSKGFKIFLYPDHREEYLGNFWAIKGNRKFIGSDPLRLLGIVSIWENTGDNWQVNDFPKEDLHDFILSRAFPDTIEDLEKLDKQEFENLISDYQLFLDNDEININDKTTRLEMFEILNTFYKE